MTYRSYQFTDFRNNVGKINFFDVSYFWKICYIYTF